MIDPKLTAVKTRSIKGRVIHGSGRGAKLGFPTANLDVLVSMNEGVYLGLANQEPALVFFGAAQTFGEIEKKVEVHILDFNGDLYGQQMEVRIVKKIRDNKKFESKESLVEQMKKDEIEARKYFNQ